MSRRDADRLDDISAAITAIRAHVDRGPLSDGLVRDAVRIRLLEIGEAVKSLDVALTSSEPEIPWRQIARMRDHLAHRYFLTQAQIIQDTVETGPRSVAGSGRSAQDPVDVGRPRRSIAKHVSAGSFLHWTDSQRRRPWEHGSSTMVWVPCEAAAVSVGAHEVAAA